MKRCYFFCILFWVAISMVEFMPFFAYAQQAENKKLTPQERAKALKEKTAERKRIQKEKLLALKKQRKEKEQLRKQQLKEKEEQRKQLVNLKKKNSGMGLKLSSQPSVDSENETQKQEDKDMLTTQKDQANAEKKMAKEKARKEKKEALARKKQEEAQEKEKEKEVLATTIPQEAKVPQEVKKVEEDTMSKSKMVASREEKKKDSTHKKSPRLRSKIIALTYNVPTKELLNDGFVKYGKLHQFQVKGLNARLYDILVNGENYSGDMRVDTSLIALNKAVQAYPLTEQASQLNTSLINNEPWIDFFRTDDYHSTATPSTYKRYIDDFNQIKTELKKEALSYKDFVGVLQTGPKQKLPMQYELLDTTFYKSYYLLFVSRVDLLKDYHNAFVNLVANLDTIRYQEVVRYKSKVHTAVQSFVDSKRAIQLVLDTLSRYTSAIDEYYKMLFTDPSVYQGEEMKQLRDRFFTAFNLPQNADSAGLNSVRVAIRDKIMALKKRVREHLAQNELVFKSIHAYMLQSKDYADIYIKRYQEAMMNLEKMNSFVDKELSLQNRNIRFSEIVENLYRRLILEYETMRNNMKDNLSNMNNKVLAYRNFLGDAMAYDKVQRDYEALQTYTRSYVADSVYNNLSLLMESVFASVSDTVNFNVLSRVKRVREMDFIDYKLTIQPKRNLPMEVIPKYAPLTQEFRFPVYGGFVHTLSLGIGTNLSFVRHYQLGSTNTNNYRIVQDGKLTKAKLHLDIMYHFFYRTKNPNFRYGGAAGLLLDFTNLLQLEHTKVLLGPSLQFYDRFVISAGIALGAEPSLRSNFQPNQTISLQNLGNNINNVFQQLHTNTFALGAFFGVGISLF